MSSKLLTPSTWDAFAELVERNNGIYGGCWCVAFHTDYRRGETDPRTLKHQLVHSGRAHAALVLDASGRAQGWCQYGPTTTNELALRHQRAYATNPPPVPDWRIACIFVDRHHRRQGLARTALNGALDQITMAGGGLTEVISETTTGRTTQSRFLFSATAELFEQHESRRVRRVGKNAWILSRHLNAT
ncbi:MAG: GNAT family N-acetyltransferase [Solirubrobacteraceae bacterium]